MLFSKSSPLIASNASKLCWYFSSKESIQNYELAVEKVSLEVSKLFEQLGVHIKIKGCWHNLSFT
ncbi:hypothetical protein LGL55_12195 [Clostridium tagluense]|uniref:hypothetical protein n=1 Tax=Clostridium tagluense TaxID=360422 RepID=UPI001C0D8523|nr:hypothetical protein [Clostridium tagluense]MBU3128950.1 hypothetical protein [Clostridium tagluense]MCB2312144.1 hypothetical protein [Clostridium tagluense]MCB2316671.1 hypothetical protein [Clostridium tagluense]MCB2321590.1 hypothetical protein [Clostridium tagluense]MCB2326540.1 hypothetical protein [Clostridium tagluense]